MSNTATATKTRVTIKRPSMWNVVMLNDDYTPMDFVVNVLEMIYGKTQEEAVRLMQQIHNSGKAVVFQSTLEVVRQKIDDTKRVAQAAGHDNFKVIKEEDR